MSWFGHWSHHKDSDMEKKEKEEKKRRSSLSSFFSMKHHHRGSKDEKTTSEETKEKEEYSFSIYFCGPRNVINASLCKDKQIEAESLNDKSKPARAMRLYYPVRQLVHVVVQVKNIDTVGTLKLEALRKLAEQTFQSECRDARFTIVERALKMKDESDRIAYLSKEGFTSDWLRLFNKDGVEIHVSNEETVDDLLHICGEAVTFKSADFMDLSLLMPFVPYVGFVAHEPAQFLHRDPCEVAIMNAIEHTNTRTLGTEMCEFLIDSCHTVLPDNSNCTTTTSRDACMLVGLKRVLALVRAVRDLPKEDGVTPLKNALIRLEDSVVSDMSSFLISTGKCGKNERNVTSWLKRCISYCDHVSASIHTPSRDGTERLFVDPVNGNDKDATGLSSSNPLRSIKRAHDIIRAAMERKPSEERISNEMSMKSLQSTMDADTFVEEALTRCEKVWARLERVPIESIFVKTRGGRWVSYELMTRTFQVATKIIDNGMNMSKIGPCAFAARKVRDKLLKENPFEMSEAHQCVGIWILERALVRVIKVEDDDTDTKNDDTTSFSGGVEYEFHEDSLTGPYWTMVGDKEGTVYHEDPTTDNQVQYDISFRRSEDGMGQPLFDVRDVFNPIKINNSKIRTKDRFINVPNWNKPVTLSEICAKARCFDLSGHSIESFSYINKDDLPGLSQAKNLKTLSIARNCIRTLSLGSDKIVGLRNLRVLDVSHNLLSKVSVTYLPNLEYLCLSHNKLRGSCLQDVVGNMEGCDSLRVLDLSFNNFDWTPLEFRDNIKGLCTLKKLKNLVLHGNNIQMSQRCQRHAVRGRKQIDQEENEKITEIMNKIKNDWMIVKKKKTEKGDEDKYDMYWTNNAENYIMFDEPDVYTEIGTSVKTKGKQMPALCENLELTWPEKLPRIIVEATNLTSRYDVAHVTRKIQRSRESFAEGLQRTRKIVLHSNQRNAFHRWRRITRLSKIVALRFWWNILKYQTRRARVSCVESLASDPVIARLDASVVSMRDITRTGRISLLVLGEILGVKLGVTKSELRKKKGGGPIVLGATRRERAKLLRMRLVELDGCEIRMNAKDIETNSIRVPDATLRAINSKTRTLLLRDPIYIVAGFSDPMMILNETTQRESNYSPHYKQFSRFLYSVVCHNRYHHCVYVASRLQNGAAAISDPSKCSSTEFENWSNIFQIRGKVGTDLQIKRLGVLQEVLKRGHANVPLPLLPDAHRSTSNHLCTIMRDILQVSKNKGGLLELALEIRKGQDQNVGTEKSDKQTEFQDQVDLFLSTAFEASRCILRELGVSMTTTTTKRTFTSIADLRNRSRSEARIKIMSLQECVSRTTDMKISEKEYVEARMLEASSNMLASFCERVHETWKRAALLKWKAYAETDKIEAARQEARWYGVLARQSESRWNELNSKIVEMKKNISTSRKEEAKGS